MDILSGLPVQRICVGYSVGSTVFEHLPLGPADLSPFEAVYEELPSWDTDLTVFALERPASEAKGYVRRIEEISGVPVRFVSVVPEREQVVEKNL